MNQHPIPRPASRPPAGLHTGGALTPPPRAPRVRLLWERIFPSADPRRRALALGVAVTVLAVVLLRGMSRAHSAVGMGGGAGIPPPSIGSTAEPRETVPPSFSTEEEATNPPEPDAVPESDTVTDPATDRIPSPDTEPAPEPSSPPTDTPATAPSPESTDVPSEPSTDEPSTHPPAESIPETEAPPPCPEGCFAVESLDMSEGDRGAGYIRHTGVTLPPSLPVLPLWSDVPAVLLVNTHPYEGYGDGSPYYDPAAGGLALVDTPHAPDGTVALTAALSRALRDRGIAVIHLRVSTTAGESAASVHARTEELIRQYCRFYPDVGLILDIGRSAELTESGGILRTAGSLEGAPCAQRRTGGSFPRTGSFPGSGSAASPLRA